MGVSRGSNGTPFGEVHVGEGGALVVTPSPELLEWLEEHFSNEDVPGEPQPIEEGQIVALRCSDPEIFQRLQELREEGETIEDVLRGLLGLSHA